MYDLNHVRKRRRRRIAALISLIASIGVASLIVTSFLGRTTGSFTVKVVNSDVKLSLSLTEDFKESTSYLRIGKLLPLKEMYYGAFPSDDIIDSRFTAYDYGSAEIDEATNQPTSLYYIKYTFFVKNIGSNIVKYNFSVTLGDRAKSTDGTERTLDDTLRVMVYDNDITTNTHNFKTYAKESPVFHIDKNNNQTFREFLSSRPYDETTEDDEHPLVDESFKSGQTIVKYAVEKPLQREDIRRYTVVIWLEGEDKQSDPSKGIPDNASLKIGVNIDAFEN